jgi:hypothetical protein
MLNKVVNQASRTTHFFGVAMPLYSKKSLHMQCRIPQRFNLLLSERVYKAKLHAFAVSTGFGLEIEKFIASLISGVEFTELH